MEINQCQTVTFHSDPTNGSHDVGAQVVGTMLSGEVKKQKFVTREPKTGDRWLKEGRDLKALGYVSVFIYESANEYCPSVEENEKRVFVTNLECCDTLPRGGLCLVPYGVPVVEEETNPENWHTFRERKSR